MDTENSIQAQAASTTHRRAPPYTSFKTILTFMEDQQQHGVPSKIDRSVLTRFSGVVGTQLITALKFLKLIGDDQSVQPELLTMVDAYGTDDWQPKLRALLERTYTPLMEQDLARMTPAQYHDTFKELYPAKDAVVRKCEVFFLNAVKAAGVPINPRIGKPGTFRLATGQRRPSANAGTPRKKRNGSESKPPLPPPHQDQPVTVYQTLIDILDPAEMEDEEQQAVWTLIRYLKRTEASE